jgi:hypothetical protein
MAMNMATQTDVADETGPAGYKINLPPCAHAGGDRQVFSANHRVPRRGGMGVVARQPRPTGWWLKISRRNGEIRVRRTVREGGAGVAPSHPNIVTIHGLGEAADNTCYGVVDG